MKKPILIIVALISILVGCKVDETALPAESINKGLLVGQWFLKTMLVEGTIGGTPIPPDATSNFTVKDYYIFKKDNFVTTSTSASASTSDLPYSFADDKLTLGGSSGLAYTVKKLSADSLILLNSTTSTALGINITTNITFKYAHR